MERDAAPGFVEIARKPRQGRQKKMSIPFCRPYRGFLFACLSSGGSAAARLAPGYLLSPLRGSLLFFHRFTDPPHRSISNSHLQLETPFKCEESQVIQSDSVGGWANPCPRRRAGACWRKSSPRADNPKTRASAAQAICATPCNVIGVKSEINLSSENCRQVWVSCSWWRGCPHR